MDSAILPPRIFSGRISNLPREELDLSATIRSGQLFRWTFDGEKNAWRGVIEGGHVLQLAQGDGDTLFWQLTGAVESGTGAEAAVRRFLRLGEVNLAESGEAWALSDPHFAEAWALHPGVRVLRQDPDECFFSFLCASVAPIARIGSMLQAVSREYAGDAYGAFPTPSCLADVSEETFRTLGLGFRAKRVAEAARRVARDLPPGFLAALRNVSHDEAKRELTTFFGVGEKIADCVCLFALDKDTAIPVDTHIWRMARAWYLPELAGTALTAASYAKVGRAFLDTFGDKCGWAQQTLFYRSAVGSKAATSAGSTGA